MSTFILSLFFLFGIPSVWSRLAFDSSEKYVNLSIPVTFCIVKLKSLFFIYEFFFAGSQVPEGPPRLAPDLPDLPGGHQRVRHRRLGDDLSVRLRAARELWLRGELAALQRGGHLQVRHLRVSARVLWPEL